MIKKKNYIPSPLYLKEMYSNPSLNGEYKLIEKVPIRKIKIDKSLFDYQNNLNYGEVEYMVNHFYIGAWFPVMLNQYNYLIDGQHRLAVAKRLRLKYIDTVIQTNDYRLPKIKNRKEG